MHEIETALAWIAAVTLIAVVALPLLAIVLISVASVREESAHSLSGQPPGWIERAARRLLGYHTLDAHAASRAAEVRFRHARRTLPDTGQQPASGEPGAGTGSPWHREGAGV